MTCIVYNCSKMECNTSDINYFEFPKLPQFREKWIRACGWAAHQLDPNTAKICSQHFEENCFIKEEKILNNRLTYVTTLEKGAIPTLKLPTRQIIKDSLDLEETVLLDVTSSQKATNLNINKPSIELINPYAKIKTFSDLDKLRKTNETLERKIAQFKKKIGFLKASLPLQVQEHNASYIELAKLNKEYARIKRSMLSISDQKRLLAKVFSPAQIKLLSGRRKINWSDDDMAVAYTITHLSNRTCYNFLKDKFGIPLPASSTIDRWLKRGRDGETIEKISNLKDEQ